VTPLSQAANEVKTSRNIVVCRYRGFRMTVYYRSAFLDMAPLWTASLVTALAAVMRRRAGYRFKRHCSRSLRSRRETRREEERDKDDTLEQTPVLLQLLIIIVIVSAVQ